jgi:hypothetical protein
MTRRSDEAIAYEELVDFLSTFLSKNQKDSICIGVLRFQNDVQSKLSKSVESGDLDDALKLVRTLDVANYVLSRLVAYQVRRSSPGVVALDPTLIPGPDVLYLNLMWY